jgi:hypothetical protein
MTRKAGFIMNGTTGIQHLLEPSSLWSYRSATVVSLSLVRCLKPGGVPSFVDMLVFVTLVDPSMRTCHTW